MTKWNGQRWFLRVGRFCILTPPSSFLFSLPRDLWLIPHQYLQQLMMSNCACWTISSRMAVIVTSIRLTNFFITCSCRMIFLQDLQMRYIRKTIGLTVRWHHNKELCQPLDVKTYYWSRVLMNIIWSLIFSKYLTCIRKKKSSFSNCNSQ